MLQKNFITISVLATLTICVLQQQQQHYANAAITPLTLEILNNGDSIYTLQPNEVLPIQPLLIYPKTRDFNYHGRDLDKENRIIFVKLLKRKTYRPPTATFNNALDYNADENGNSNDVASADDTDDAASNLIGKVEQYNGPNEFNMKDIFYVKALANGMFNHQHIKVYRLPEFYAINVFRNGKPIL